MTQRKHFYATCAAVIVLNLMILFLPFGIYREALAIALSIAISALLVKSFVAIRGNMLRFHEDKYDEFKLSLWVYFLFDFSTYVI